MVNMTLLKKCDTIKEQKKDIIKYFLLNRQFKCDFILKCRFLNCTFAVKNNCAVCSHYTNFREHV